MANTIRISATGRVSRGWKGVGIAKINQYLTHADRFYIRFRGETAIWEGSALECLAYLEGRLSVDKTVIRVDSRIFRRVHNLGG